LELRELGNLNERRSAAHRSRNAAIAASLGFDQYAGSGGDIDVQSTNPGDMNIVQAFEQSRQSSVIIRILIMPLDRQRVVGGAFIGKKCRETDGVIMKRYGRNQKDKK